jgi:hypothetical protein
LQKLHELLHFPLILFFFHHAENFDAGTGERHLKDVFKDVTRNSQQRGQDTFLHQVGARMHEKLRTSGKVLFFFEKTENFTKIE